MSQVQEIVLALDTSIQMESRTAEHHKPKEDIFPLLSLEERSRILTLFSPSLQSTEFWTIKKSPLKDILREAEFFTWSDFDLNKRLK